LTLFAGSKVPFDCESDMTVVREISNAMLILKRLVEVVSVNVGLNNIACSSRWAKFFNP